MKFRPSQVRTGLAWVAALFFFVHATAPLRVNAQGVQLPVVRQFGVTTSVLVPDGGAMHMGGVRSAREGSVSRGTPFFPGPLGRNRAIGREVGTSDAWALVRIIDLKEWDRMTLAAAAPVDIARLSNTAAGMTATVRKNHVSDTASSSLAELRARHITKSDRAYSEARRKLGKAQAMEQGGKQSSAKMLYRVAYRDGDAKTRASARAAMVRLSLKK